MIGGSSGCGVCPCHGAVQEKLEPMLFIAEQLIKVQTNILQLSLADYIGTPSRLIYEDLVMISYCSLHILEERFKP